MERIKDVISNTYYAEWIMLSALLLTGGFNEYISCMLAAAASVFLIIKIIKNRELIFNVNITSVSVVILAVGYLLTTIYALDSGMAFIGFLKFMPVMLYMLLLMQDENAKNSLIGKLPYIALVLGLISFVFMFVPLLSDYFSVADRLGGFFQYPNTFAIFMLTGELVVVSKEWYKPFDYVTIALLILLILLTGSRAVFVLTVVSNILMLFFKKGKKIKIIVAVSVAILAISVVLLLPVLRDNELLSRYFSMSLSESTFVGRILYYVDALPTILKNPFGLGYMGYYYIQQSIQTGVYSVKFIHNDILQIMLDVGWLPCVLFVAAIIKSFFSKKSNAGKRIVLMTIFLHSLFDFDLQFTAIFFVLLLFMDIEAGKRLLLKKHNSLVAFATGILGLTSLYFSIALALGYFGNYAASDAMYPCNTENKISLMVEKASIKEQDKLADSIISQNKYVQIAYSAKARYAYSQGDFEKLIKYKNKVFETAPFSYEEYEEYCYMLIQGIYMYGEIGDEYSAKYCRKELVKTSETVSRLDDRLSDLGKMIEDQPKTELPKDVVEYINALS